MEGGGDASGAAAGGGDSTAAADSSYESGYSDDSLTTTQGTVGAYGIPPVYAGARNPVGPHRCGSNGRCRMCDFVSSMQFYLR